MQPTHAHGENLSRARPTDFGAFMSAPVANQSITTVVPVTILTGLSWRGENDAAQADPERAAWRANCGD